MNLITLILKGDRNFMKIMCKLKGASCAEKEQGNCMPCLYQESRSLVYESSWLPRYSTCTPFNFLRLLALMMVTVAGLPVWKHYSKAAALSMPLQALQIMSKGDMEEGKKKKIKEVLEDFVGQKYKTSLCSGRKWCFFKFNFSDIKCLRTSNPVQNQSRC